MTESPRMTQPTEAGRARFDALVDELRNELDVVGASMFGMPSIKRRGGKAFAGLSGDDMVFKLDGDEHAAALALEGAHLFEPMAGRPMKAWVQVPPTHETQWADLARKAEAGLEG
jgi:molybdopterin biosynthesis enzyme MoaB